MAAYLILYRAPVKNSFVIPFQCLSMTGSQDLAFAFHRQEISGPCGQHTEHQSMVQPDVHLLDTGQSEILQQKN